MKCITFCGGGVESLIGSAGRSADAQRASTLRPSPVAPHRVGSYGQQNLGALGCELAAAHFQFEELPLYGFVLLIVRVSAELFKAHHQVGFLAGNLLLEQGVERAGHEAGQALGAADGQR